METVIAGKSTDVLHPVASHERICLRESVGEAEDPLNRPVVLVGVSAEIEATTLNARFVEECPPDSDTNRRPSSRLTTVVAVVAGRGWPEGGWEVGGSSVERIGEQFAVWSLASGHECPAISAVPSVLTAETVAGPDIPHHDLPAAGTLPDGKSFILGMTHWNGPMGWPW